VWLWFHEAAAAVSPSGPRRRDPLDRCHLHRHPQSADESGICWRVCLRQEPQPALCRATRRCARISKISSKALSVPAFGWLTPTLSHALRIVGSEASDCCTTSASSCAISSRPCAVSGAYCPAPKTISDPDVNARPWSARPSSSEDPFSVP
jgi:hypothetical protein